MSENDDFIKTFMHFNAKTAQKHIEFYMNNKTFYHSKMLIININCNKFYRFEVYYAKKKSNNVY